MTRLLAFAAGAALAPVLLAALYYMVEYFELLSMRRKKGK